MRMSRKIATVLSLTVIFFFIQSHVILALSLGPLDIKSKPGEKFEAVIPIELEPSENPDDLVVSLGDKGDYSLIGESMPADMDKIHVTIMREGGIKALLYTDEPVENTEMNIVLKAFLNGGTMLKRYSLKIGEGVSKAVGLAKNEVRTGIYGPVVEGDTLSDVIYRLGYRGSDLKKAIVAAWMNNPSDFVGSNLHGLKKGAILHMTELEQDMTAFTEMEAQHVIVAQWEEWNKITRVREDSLRAEKEKKVGEPLPAVPAPVKTKPAQTPVMTASLAGGPDQFPEDLMGMNVVQAKVDTAPTQTSATGAIAASTGLKVSDQPVYMSDIRSLRGEMQKMSQKFNKEIFLLQDSAKARTEASQITNWKLILLFYALIGQTIIVAALLLISRRRMSPRRRFAGLESSGAAVGEPLR